MRVYLKSAVILFFGLSMLIFSSCGKDEPEVKPSILGKWDLLSIKGDYFTHSTNKLIGSEEETYIPGETVLEFNASNQVLIYEGGFVEDVFNYQYEKNKLIFKYDLTGSDNDTFFVSSLNNTDLIFKGIEIDTSDDFRSESTFNLKRK